jgi:hypothetical protein
MDTGTGDSPGNDRPAADAPVTDTPSPDAPVAQGAIEGRVFMAGAGMPVVGAIVRAPGALTTTTDAQGIFRLAAVREGTVVLQAHAAYLATTFKPAAPAATPASSKGRSATEEPAAAARGAACAPSAARSRPV